MNEQSQASQTLIVEREIMHPLDKVWRALTQGPLIEEWLMANDFKPVVGHRFTFRTTPMAHWNGIVESEVVLVEPQTRLAYRWDTTAAGGGGLKTIVTWHLTPTAQGVLVRMEQIGFGPDDTQNYQGAAFGWRRNLAALEQVAGAQAA